MSSGSGRNGDRLRRQRLIQFTEQLGELLILLGEPRSADWELRIRREFDNRTVLDSQHPLLR
jgi:hypothetical protein